MRPSGLGSRVDAREYGERVRGLLRRRVVIASRQRDSTGGLVCAAERQAEVGFGRDLECLRAQRLGPIEMSRETVRFRQKRGEPGFEGSQSELVQRRDGLLERVDGAREIALLQRGVPEEAGRDRAVQGVSRLLNGPLTVRDATANNLAEVLDFSRPNLAAPAVAVPPSPIGVPCPAGALLPSGQPVPAGEEEDEWAALRLIARDDGWPV